VLVQATTGILFFSGIKQFRSADKAPWANSMTLQIILWVLFLSGSLASFLHLGKPSNVFNVLQGIKTGSPLSLEVVSVAVFGALLLIYNVLTWKKTQIQKYNVLLGTTVFAGLVLCYAISRVYTLPTVPAWDSAWTTIQFFMSALALGVAGFLFIHSRKQEEDFLESMKIWIIVAIGILFLLMVTIVLYNKWAGNLVVQFDVNTHEWILIIIRLVLLAVSISLLIIALEKDIYSSWLMYTFIFLCVFGSELSGRISFYNMQKISGMLQIFAY
jgi:anaerobic dimethyl sulfoxide reductase subunit C (anchor subunit)